MNPWLKSIFLAAALLITLCALPFIVGMQGDSHIGNWGMILAALVCAASLALGLLAGWCWQRWFLRIKQPSLGAVTIAAVISFIMFSVISHPMLGEFWWRISPSLGLFPGVFCGVPLIYLLLLCRRPKETAEPVDDPNRLGAGPQG